MIQTLLVLLCSLSVTDSDDTIFRIFHCNIKNRTLICSDSIQSCCPSIPSILNYMFAYCLPQDNSTLFVCYLATYWDVILRWRRVSPRISLFNTHCQPEFACGRFQFLHYEVMKTLKRLHCLIFYGPNSGLGRPCCQTYQHV